MQPVSGHNRTNQIYVKEIIAFLSKKGKMFFTVANMMYTSDELVSTVVEHLRCVDKPHNER